MRIKKHIALFAVFSLLNTASAFANVPITDLSTLLANAKGSSEQSRLASAQILGWVSMPGQNMCNGSFLDPYIAGSSETLPPLKTTPVQISADSGAFRYTGASVLTGKVVLTQPGRIVTADSAKLNATAGDIKTVSLYGDLFLRESGKVVVAQQGDVDLKNNIYQLHQIIYRLFLSKLSAWGKADKITQPPSGITELKGVSYSTCPPQSRAWEMQASSIDLNQETGRGYAHNAVLYTHGIPIFYTPYFNFPIDSRRQSGILFPQFSTSTISGFGFGVPYYWNIAPNQDNTFMPYFYAKRGLQFNNDYRYLTVDSSGEFKASFLPNDLAFRQFQQTEPSAVPAGTPGVDALENATPNRSYLFFIDKTQLNPQWSGNVNYSRVSDDYYLQDFNGVPVAVTNQLLQQGQIQYQASDWNFLGNLQSYQTLHPVNEAFVDNQYSMLPQLLFTSNLAQQRNTLDYQWILEAVNFTKAPNPGQVQTPPTGDRFNAIPGVSLPLNNAEGFITPTAQFELTQYNLGDQPQGFNDEITRALPIFNIDSGLYFERDTSFFGNDYAQTLEPRIFYLYVPYHNQDDIPVFDSALQPFTYSQLFLTNRFTGSDRIGDANQISFALSTNFTDEKTGEQKFSAGVGVIDYFENRRVTICNTQGCQDSLYATGSTSPTESTSPLAGQINYAFNPDWHALSNAAWDAHSGQWQNANLTFQYMPLANHIVNVGYSFIRYGDIYSLPGPIQSNSTLPANSSLNNLSEPVVSAMWPVSDQLSLLGSWSYSLNQNHAQTYFYGVQYDSCCWATQVVFARTFLDLNNLGQPQFSNGVYVQWALKGLGTIAANDPSSLLLSSIPGYQNTFGQT